ncbi:MAG: HAMP domain-containing histidine kinase, partial [Candidatus Omnitrophica bacterium]|nr:HAMP domain-containing histidine kinase [Candidatus Omnitrophota bacterium]
TVIEQSIEIVNQDPHFEQIAFEKNLCQSPSYVPDRGLAVVFHNLFKNAQHAMNGVGTIRVSTQLQNGTVTVQVADTGPGIPESVRNRIFDPFFSTKSTEDGTGIGLTICREIIERSGGTITCDNDHGKGARFTITLPRNARNAVPQKS